MKRSLTKNDRLRNRKDIAQLFRSGHQFKTSGMRLYVKNCTDSTRFLFCPARKFGTSVERNKAKRHAREIIRVCKDKIASGYFIGVMIYPGDYSFQDRTSQIIELLKKSKMLTESGTLQRS